MSVWRQVSAALVLFPSLALFLVGIYLTLRSGVRGLSRGQDLRVLAINLTSVVLRVVGYLVGLFAVQQLIGAPMALQW
jgi:hypothetical protein